MMNGRMDATITQRPADNRKQAVPAQAPASRAQSGVSDTATVRFGSPQDSSNDGRAASCSGRGESPQRSRMPARATLGLESGPQSGNRLRAGRDRRQERFLPFDQTSRWLAQTGLDHRDRLLSGVEHQEQQSLALAHWIAGQDAKGRQPLRRLGCQRREKPDKGVHW